MQNSGRWEPWLQVVKNSQLFTQHAHSPGIARAQCMVRPQRRIGRQLSALVGHCGLWDWDTAVSVLAQGNEGLCSVHSVILMKRSGSHKAW